MSVLSPEFRAELEAGLGQPLSLARLLIPSSRQGRSVSASCLHRWAFKGVRGPDGTLTKLEVARLAGRWITTPPAISRFIERQTPAADGPPSPQARSLANRLRAGERAGRELEKLGI